MPGYGDEEILIYINIDDKIFANLKMIDDLCANFMLFFIRFLSLVMKFL